MTVVLYYTSLYMDSLSILYVISLHKIASSYELLIISNVLILGDCCELNEKIASAQYVNVDWLLACI